jgi:hypothetical protein
VAHPRDKNFSKKFAFRMSIKRHMSNLSRNAQHLLTLGGLGSGVRGHTTALKAGDMARFDGKSADGKVEGSMDVKIINPHSNVDKVTHTKVEGKKHRDYEGAFTHIPTATVQNSRGTVFEAHHFTLQPK